MIFQTNKLSHYIFLEGSGSPLFMEVTVSYKNLKNGANVLQSAAEAISKMLLRKNFYKKYWILTYYIPKRCTFVKILVLYWHTILVFFYFFDRERENYKNSIQKRVPPPKKAISRLMNPIPSSIKHSRVLTFFFMTTTKNYFIKGTSLPIVYKHSSYEHSTMSVGIFKKSANCKRKTWQLVSGNQPKNRFFKVGWTRLFVIFLGGGGKKWRKALVTTCL